MTTGAIFICGDGGPLTVPNPDCPNAAGHTPCPEGYVAWHAWAGRMAQKHGQRRCAGCDLYVIWIPGRVS